MWRIWIALAFLAVFPDVACAYKDVPPKRRDVFSANGEFVIDVNPVTQIHTVYKSDDKKAPLWTLQQPSWITVYLSNDGEVVTTVAGKYVEDDELDKVCLGFHNKDGCLKSYTYQDLCPWPRRNYFDGPKESFWRFWYTELASWQGEFTVETTGLYEYTFSLTTGEIVQKRFVARNLIFHPWVFWPFMAAVGLGGVVWWWWRRRKKARLMLKAPDPLIN